MEPIRKKSKVHKIDPEGFVGVPRRILESFAYRNLSAHGVKLLMDLYQQYYGNNNGDLSAPFSTMNSKHGWKSKGTLSRAIKELVEAGLIEVSRQGGKNQCSLYAVTFRPIDDCNGKLDIKPTTKATDLWMKHQPLPSIQKLQREKQLRDDGKLLKLIESRMQKTPAPYEGQ